MRRLLSHRPSPAIVIALIALFVSLGGGAYAAIDLPANTVGTKQLKNNAVGVRKLKNHSITKAKLRNNSVTSAKVKNHSLLAKDFKHGQLPAGPQGPVGPQGVQGPLGPEGPAGSALAYAEVGPGGILVEGRSKNITQANVSNPAVGVYCFAGLSFTPHNVVATRQGTATAAGVVNAILGTGLECPMGTQVTLTVSVWNGTTFVLSANYIMVLFN